VRKLYGRNSCDAVLSAILFRDVLMQVECNTADTNGALNDRRRFAESGNRLQGQVLHLISAFLFRCIQRQIGIF